MLTTLFMGLAPVEAKVTVRIKALGSSPRGQFVAFEEFGYSFDKAKVFSKIRVMNVWKNRYVDKVIEVKGTGNTGELKKVREQAKKIAYTKLKKFNIEM